MLSAMKDVRLEVEDITLEDNVVAYVLSTSDLGERLIVFYAIALWVLRAREKVE